MDSDLIYTYHPDQNPGGQATPDAIPGVPLRDLTVADLAALPAHLVASVAACPFYAPVAPADATPEEG